MPSTDPGLGFVCVGIAILFFGSNFVVTKKYKTGDGMFFQWVMCVAVWFMGLLSFIVECNISPDNLPVQPPTYVMNATYGNSTHLHPPSPGAGPRCPTFEPFSMLGGVLWCFGNVWTVSIIKTVGLGLGLCIWGTTNMVVGWACGRFGILGPAPSAPHNPIENSLGVVVCVAALVIFLFIKPSLDKDGASAAADSSEKRGGAASEDDDFNVGGIYSNVGRAPLINGGSSLNDYGVDAVVPTEPAGKGGRAAAAEEDEGELSFVDKLSPVAKTVFGITMSVVSGLFYGVNFNPPQYVVDHLGKFHGAPPQLRDHIFPHFCGILVTSTVFMLAYAASSRNAPKLYPEIVLPGFVSGVMWAVAQICWFIANQNLSQALAFPLISVGPGFVGALWGVFVFREIRGKRNFILLTAAFLVAIMGAVLITLSTMESGHVW